MRTPSPAVVRSGLPAIIISASPSSRYAIASYGAVCSLSPWPSSKANSVMVPVARLTSVRLTTAPLGNSQDLSSERFPQWVFHVWLAPVVKPCPPPSARSVFPNPSRTLHQQRRARVPLSNKLKCCSRHTESQGELKDATLWANSWIVEHEPAKIQARLVPL